MEPFQKAYAGVISGPNGFEQTIPFIYLDTHKPPLTTVGTGCAIDLKEAQTLRWIVDGQAGDASAEDISDGYFRVSRMKPGMKASAYRYSGCLILPDDQQLVLLQKRFDAASALLRNMFPAFDSYPETAKTGLLEMPFTLGLHGFQTSYPTFRAAVARAGLPDRTPEQRKQDWLIASRECKRNAWDPAFDRRNGWAKGMFEMAASSVGPIS